MIGCFIIGVLWMFYSGNCEYFILKIMDVIFWNYGCYILETMDVYPNYGCFILRAARLSNKVLEQGYVKERLISSSKKLYGRYVNIIKQYENPLSRMLNDCNSVALPNTMTTLHRSDFIPIIDLTNF